MDMVLEDEETDEKDDCSLDGNGIINTGSGVVNNGFANYYGKHY